MINVKTLSKSAISYLRFCASDAKDWTTFCDGWGTAVPSITVIMALFGASLLQVRPVPGKEKEATWVASPKGHEVIKAHAGREGLPHTPTT